MQWKKQTFIPYDIASPGVVQGWPARPGSKKERKARMINDMNKVLNNNYEKEYMALDLQNRMEIKQATDFNSHD